MKNPELDDYFEKASKNFYPHVLHPSENLMIKRVDAVRFFSEISVNYQEAFGQPYQDLVPETSLSKKYLKQKALQDRHVEHHLIYKDSKVMGWLTGEMLDEETFYIRNSAVLPQFQNRGVGGLLLEHTVEFLTHLGYERVTSCHRPENRSVIKLMLSRNFMISGVEQDDRFGFQILTLFLANSDRRARARCRLGTIPSTGWKENSNTPFRLRPHDSKGLIQALDAGFQITSYDSTEEGAWVYFTKLQ